MRKLMVIGQGYVGLPLAVEAAEAGYDVTGVDVDVCRVKLLNAGESFVEDVSSARLEAALLAGRYRAVLDPAESPAFDVCVITVPTPLRDGAPDLSHIVSAGESIAPLLRRGQTVVLESTTYPGTTEELLQEILEDGSGLRAPEDFHLGYSPERIDPGNPRWGLANTPKIVSGVSESSLRAVADFYSDIVERVVPVSGTRVAELSKLLENTFRHVNIALVNELAVFAAELGIDVWESIDAASTKPFGYLRFVPGPGVGGHCLPIDPSYLSWKVKRSLGHNFRFVELANDVNEHMPDYVAHRLMLGLNQRGLPVRGSRVLLLGMAYKKNTGDARESPAAEVAKRLRRLGADVAAVDPFAAPPAGVEPVDLTPEELRRADAVVLLTDHDVFDYALVQEHASYIFDTRRRCEGENVELL
ncbi:UDP-N-acetyl-D-glucosamine dehydrogenase [Acrocarpospora phusangensis]|uniref:UDP-N-acetyl-D-glucosamine dehydrogenase n=1 Tax=Acrocarpospora phusangensis TaxID=1070424 RepID=A0A919QCC3_9ACTN|nr:nucleotide sugar dehydrogenase [Acrocarpospora phusangensis]GIH24025.1 UDP-N-acetyl-D-glucosamine dehydrogenase [Acrocarpospora phusangensis]